MPPYVICTNKMFAALVKARPQSLTQLGNIEHFGKAKLEKYGRELLAILTKASHRQPITTPATPNGSADDIVSP